jgi:phosphoglycerate dehydrogenase-like enzyme
MKKDKKNEMGYIGLGKMGKNMVFRLLDAGWNIVAYNPTPESVEEVKQKGGLGPVCKTLFPRSPFRVRYGSWCPIRLWMKL